jgi:peptide/nickel transport system ATP-binding protein
MPPLLDIVDLSVSYATDRGMVRALSNVSLRVELGQTLGIVGESGSGKSTLASAMMALLPSHAQVTGQLVFNQMSLFAMGEAERRRLRGNGIAAVFQDPFTSLNPVIRIGRQLVEFQHQKAGRGPAERTRRALEMLTRVGISDPALRMRQYPFELSGGIRQRIGIAAALLTDPLLLVADEPTTALDATTEVQIVELLRASRTAVDGALVFVSHDLGLVADLCDRIAVMYAGEIVEIGAADDIINAPRHPYTRALLACDPANLASGAQRFPTIQGQAPDPAAPRRGCVFAARCVAAMPGCTADAPPMITRADDDFARCHLVAA